jgi:hypothetical protein
MGVITILRSIGIAFLLAAAASAHAGITYQLRVERPRRTTVSTVWADGSSYRVETRASEDMDEFQRQYPIVISTDGGKTQLHLRPANETWFAQSSEAPRWRDAIGKHPRVRRPKVDLIRESANEEIAGLATRRYVLKASCVIETEEGSETLKRHLTRTVLLSVADVACAPAAVRQLHPVSVGIPELDEPIGRSLASIDGFIVQQVDSLAEWYEGGSPRSFVTTTEVVDPRCVEVDAAMFAVPKGYRRQDPVIGIPGQ